MPIDLTAGIIGITALSVLGFMFGRQINSQRPTQRPIRFPIALLLALLFAWSLSGNLSWALLLPDASVVSWANIMPILLCLTAGLASASRALEGTPRAATIVALILLAIGYAVTPLARPMLVPAIVAANSRWSGDICLQSHPSTCGPAAAATLLRLADIPANERNLAEACLTSRQGTEPLGLYRGVAAVASQYGRQPRVASSNPESWTDRGQLPNIALVRLPTGPSSDPLQRLLGPRGEGHAVVVLGRSADGQWAIADPAFGRTHWTDEEFRRRFTGDAIYLLSKIR